MAGAAGTQNNIGWKSLEGAQERNFGTEKKGKVVKEIIHPTFEFTRASVHSSLPRRWPELLQKGSAGALMDADDLDKGEHETQSVQK